MKLMKIETLKMNNWWVVQKLNNAFTHYRFIMLLHIQTQTFSSIPGFSIRALDPLGSHGAVLWGHVQRPSLGNFAEAFTSMAKPKCHDI